MLIEPVRRQLVLVSGPPGAGKTTIAGPLAAELGFALLAKDRIKEALHDALGLDADPEWSRQLGAASMELLWALAADAPAAVLEANFWPNHPLHAAHVRQLGAATTEVHCSCPLVECRRRYAERAASRHPAHGDMTDLGIAGRGSAESSAVTADFAGLFARSARPLGLGPVITVDTTRPVDIATLADEVRKGLAAEIA